MHQRPIAIVVFAFPQPTLDASEGWAELDRAAIRGAAAEFVLACRLRNDYRHM